MNGFMFRLLALIALLVGGLIAPHGLAAANAPARAQSAMSVTVGTSTVGYSGDWEFSSIASDQALFTHRTLPDTVFGFMDLTDGSVPIPSNAILLRVEVGELFRSNPDVQRMDAEGSGTLPGARCLPRAVRESGGE